MKMFVENLTQIDFSYLHTGRGLLGESWSVDLILDGDLDEQGMICDFSIVKKRVKQWLDTHVDHCLLVPTAGTSVLIGNAAERTTVDCTYPQGGRFHCSAPDQAICTIDTDQITEESLAQWCAGRLLEQFGSGVRGIQLKLKAEQINGASYHYSHGLQQHAGNCQRIAHGHRSRLMVLRNGERDAALETAWAERLKDGYIGTRAHLRSTANEHCHFAYTATQGAFELLLPERVCYLMDTETTVEQIASHLAAEIKRECPADQIEVHAFEGIGKGAIAEA